MRATFASLLFGTVLAQAPTIDDLRSPDWRVRNATAAALAKAPTIDAAALVRSLGQPWDGQLPDLRRYGGRYGGARQADPRQRVLAAVATIRDNGQPDNVLAAHQRMQPRSAADLVVPHHPHSLAAWLLQGRPEAGPAIAAAAEQGNGNTFELASAWFVASQPDLDAVLPRLQNAESARSVALALCHGGDRGLRLLQEALGRGDPVARRAILALGEPSLLADERALGAAVQQMLSDSSERHRLQAAWSLEQVPTAAVAAVASRLAGAPEALRGASGWLCRLGEHAQPTGELLVPFVDEAHRDTRHRVLVALGSFDLAASARPEAARRLFDVVTGRRDVDTRLLALDALARQGEAVDAAMRERLATMLSSPPFTGAAARTLGCLRRLGSVPTMSTAAKAALAVDPVATTDTWLALADDGAAGAELLRPLLAGPPGTRDAEACARRLATTAPRALEAWLAADEPQVQRLAIHGLCSLGPPAEVPTPKLVELLDSPPEVASEAFRWLATRSDVARFQQPICAAVVRLWPGGAASRGTEVVASLRVPPEVLFTALEPLLCLGHGWPAVRNAPPVLRRQACRGWLDATEDAEVADRLLAELGRLGLQDDEVPFARTALASAHCDHLLSALLDAPSLPAALRPDLQDLIDLQVPAQGFGSRASRAVEVLWAHRAR